MSSVSQQATGALMEYSPSKAAQQPFQDPALANVSAEDVGQLIHHLQEEIKIIK